MKRKRKQIKPVSLYDLWDWYCPEWVEWKDGSTPDSGLYLAVHGLLDGRYQWHITQTRDRFEDGTPCEWRYGVSPMDTESKVCDTFELALKRAREQLKITPFARWVTKAQLKELVGE